MHNLFNKRVKDQAAQAQSTEKKELTVIKARCPQNHPCPSVRVCPTGALSQTGYAAPVVHADSCTSCGKCVRFCPMKALVLQ
jgi:Fe-S-cluster-containing hydrogenase component 2